MVIDKREAEIVRWMPQYYVDGSHPAIIPKELFLQVQEEIARRGTSTDATGRKR